VEYPPFSFLLPLPSFLPLVVPRSLRWNATFLFGLDWTRLQFYAHVNLFTIYLLPNVLRTIRSLTPYYPPLIRPPRER
jgi:hypothetical protein